MNDVSLRPATRGEGEGAVAAPARTARTLRSVLKRRCVAYGAWVARILSLCVTAWPVAAAAQEPELGAEELSVVAPQVLSAAVVYPAGAEGEASVTLRFVVTVDGRVDAPEVLVGDEPFASAALAASSDWRFQPALRGGRPVPVRILMEARFQPPQPEAPVAPTDAPTGASVTEAPAPVALPAVPGGPAETPPDVSLSTLRRIDTAQEVLVEDTRPPGTASISRAEARQIPGALFGDPLRALDILPGVSTMISGLPVFYVRGAPPGNVGFFVDEIRVPILYHAFLGPSVVSPELIEGVNLHASAYPGRFGTVAGGAVEAALRTPSYERSAGLGLGLWDTSGFVESPFAGENGNVFLAGRYSLTGLLISSITPQSLSFWNYQGLVDYNLTPRDQLRLFGFGAHDVAENPGQDSAATDFHRVDVRYSHTFGLDTRAYVGLTWGVDETRFPELSIGDRSIAARARFEHSFSPTVLLRSGVSFRRADYKLGLGIDASSYLAISDLFRARDETVTGGFVEMPLRLTQNLLVVPGVRLDVYGSEGDHYGAIDPRISARYRLHPRVDAVHSLSYSHQPPNFVPSILPGVNVAGLDGGLQRSLQSSAGVDLKLPDEIRGRATAFQNAFFDLTDPYSLTQRFSLSEVLGRQRMFGHSYGLEFELRKPLTRRLGAFFSYTLSRSTRAFDSISTLAGSDRTHVLNLAAMYTLGANWRLGARGVLYSGVPGKLKGASTFPYERTRPFFRADFRLERRFRLGPKSYWSAVVELLNATASQEEVHNICSPREGGGAPVCTQETLPRITLPNLKIEARL